MGQYTGTEEDLALSYPVEIGVQFQGLDHLGTGLLAIHETLGDHVWSQQLIALFELLEEDAVGEALATDADPFQDAIAAQLIQDKGRVDLACLQETQRESVLEEVVRSAGYRKEVLACERRVPKTKPSSRGWG